MSLRDALTAAAADSTRSSTGAPARSTVQVHQGSAQLPADAVKLLRDLEVDDIQFGFDWLRNLERTVFQGERARVLYFVLRQGGDAVAVVPMVERVGRWGMNLEALANYYTSLYAPALRPG